MVAKRKLSDTKDSSYPDGSGARSSSTGADAGTTATTTTTDKKINGCKSRRTAYFLPPIKLSSPISCCRSTLTGSSGSSKSSSRKTSGNSEGLPSVKEVIASLEREEAEEPVGLSPPEYTFPPQHNYYPYCYQLQKPPVFTQPHTPFYQVNLAERKSFSPVLSSTPLSSLSESGYSSSLCSNEIKDSDSGSNNSSSSQNNNAATPEKSTSEEDAETAVSEKTPSADDGKENGAEDEEEKLFSGPPAFPYALFNVIIDPGNSEWIKWYRADETADTWSFKLLDWHRLIRSLKEQGMRASRRASVTKNLLDYGFERLSDGRKRIADKDGRVWHKFAHPFFQPGGHDQLSQITRRTN